MGELSPDEAVGVRLQQALDAQGMSQSELARRAGVNLGTINRTLKGGKGLQIQTARKIAGVLGLSPRFLMEGNKPEDDVPGPSDPSGFALYLRQSNGLSEDDISVLVTVREGLAARAEVQLLRERLAHYEAEPQPLLHTSSRREEAVNPPPPPSSSRRSPSPEHQREEGTAPSPSSRASTTEDDEDTQEVFEYEESDEPIDTSGLAAHSNPDTERIVREDTEIPLDPP